MAVPTAEPKTSAIRPPQASAPERSASALGPALGIAIGLAALTLAVYLRTVHNGFISYDDYDYISGNLLVRGGLSWHGVAQAFSSIDQSNWFPLEWISLMATAQWFGPNPAAYHLTNLLLHAVNVVLLFLLLDGATRERWRAAAVAALFAVLPLNVEAVAWATERKSVLSVFFLLLALAAYGSYVRRPNPARYALVAIPFALGLMTKAWLVSFPFALLLLDYWPFCRFGNDPDTHDPGRRDVAFGRLVAEKIPLILMSLAMTAVGVYAARAGEALSISAAHAPMLLRLENALWSYLSYIGKTVWPAHLAIIYPYPQHLLPPWKIAAAVVVLTAATAGAWRLREKRYLIVGWLWFLGMLFPLIGLIQTGTQAMADRWAYIADWGLLVAAVWLAGDCWKQLKASRAALLAITGCLLAGYAAAAYQQAGYWHDNLTLYTHALAVTKNNGPVHLNLGVEYESLGRPDLAFAEYSRAVADTPSLGIAHYNLARLLDDQHQEAQAMEEYRLAITNTGVRHEISQAHDGLAKIYGDMGLLDKAAAEFSLALEANPGDVYARVERGMIELQGNDLKGAERDLATAAQLMPTARMWFTLGQVLEKERKWAEAVHAYQTALQLDPGMAEAQMRLREVQSQDLQ